VRGSTKHTDGQKTSYWLDVLGDVVIHSLAANIRQFGCWRVSDEFVINVQDDNSVNVILIISIVIALFISLRGECFHVE
jgi:hypothetical protein